jgi:hypothetical protein
MRPTTPLRPVELRYAAQLRYKAALRATLLFTALKTKPVLGLCGHLLLDALPSSA